MNTTHLLSNDVIEHDGRKAKEPTFLGASLIVAARLVFGPLIYVGVGWCIDIAREFIGNGSRSPS